MPSFLDYDIDIRHMICSTNAIEPLNTCIGGRSAHAAWTRPGPDRLMDDVPGNPVLNAFAITFDDRWPGAETY